MAAQKAGDRMRKQKEARQKKLLLFFLVPLLVIVAVVQGPRLMKHFSSAKEKTQVVQGKVVQGYEELAPTVPTTTTGAPAETTAGAAVAATRSFVDTDTPAKADDDQLISFTRFSARDPFVQLVDDTSEGGDTATASGDTTVTTPTDTVPATTPPAETTPATTPPTDTGTTTDTTGGSTASTQVSISVNGAVVVVTVGETFPSSDPAFKLVAISGDVVKIGLASGSFSNGVQTLDLRAGESVTLISQPDGARFTIKIVKLG